MTLQARRRRRGGGDEEEEASKVDPLRGEGVTAEAAASVQRPNIIISALFLSRETGGLFVTTASVDRAVF